MKKKNQDRKTWIPYYTRVTPTKKEKISKMENKHKGRRYDASY
jgi:hypothetical protein